MDGLKNLIDAVQDKIYEIDGDVDIGITSATRITAASKITSVDELRDAIEEELDSDLAAEIVELAFSEDDMFKEYQFTPKEVFFSTDLANKEPKEVAEAFFYGKDLDADKKPADPTKGFFRLNSKDNVESTDYPGDIYLYYDSLVEDIVEYILDNRDTLEFPDYIQELIDEYNENSEE